MDKVKMAKLLQSGDVILTEHGIGIYSETREVELVYLYTRPWGLQVMAFAELGDFTGWRKSVDYTPSEFDKVFRYLCRQHYTTIYRVMCRELLFCYNGVYHPGIHWLREGIHAAHRVHSIKKDNIFRGVMTISDIREDFDEVGRLATTTEGNDSGAASDW